MKKVLPKRTRKIDIIIQGGLYPGTIRTAEFYTSHHLVSKVVVSTWETEDIEQKDITNDDIILLKNKYPDYIGPGNLNLHLLSSKNGLDHCTNEVVLKIRSDECMSYDGISTWIDYFNRHDNGKTLDYLDGTKQRSKICVIATNINFPYHPQDHVFIGYQEDLRKLFHMPFSNEPPLMPEPIEFSTRTGHLRNPIYIGANYFALFYEESAYHLENWELFLLDNSPKREEAKQFYLEHRNSIFRPLPVIDMWWEKFNSEYWWQGYARGGDMYAEEYYTSSNDPDSLMPPQEAIKLLQKEIKNEI